MITSRAPDGVLPTLRGKGLIVYAVTRFVVAAGKYDGRVADASVADAQLADSM